MNRKYSTISPSAISLLKMKAHTAIPFAREAAALLEAMPDPMPDPLGDIGNELGYWLRILHFERRYLGVDQLLDQVYPRNILELSSGFSFRGMDRATREDVSYIDTDLPEIIRVKLKMVHELQAGRTMKGRLDTLPLNALDKAAFDTVTGRFEHGSIAIVNEGLLMYLDREEKRLLCRQIHALLITRGGCWITGDVYKRQAGLAKLMGTSAGEGAFMQQHKIEDKKFDSFDAAKQFFESEGFAIKKIAQVATGQLTAYPRIQELMTPVVSTKLEEMGEIQQTWMLVPAQ